MFSWFVMTVLAGFAIGDANEKGALSFDSKPPFVHIDKTKVSVEYSYPTGKQH